MGQKHREFTDNLFIRYALGVSELGGFVVAATDAGICALFLGDDPDDLVEQLAARFPDAGLERADEAMGELVEQVVEHIEAPALGAEGLRLDLRGTEFQRRVWAALCDVPAGQTATYTEIAQAIDSPNGARAVAGACAANKVAVLVPCHRVLRADGGLSGYRWGVKRKRALLDRELLGGAL